MNRLHGVRKRGGAGRSVEARLNQLTKPRLVEMARWRGVRGFYAMRKAELVRALRSGGAKQLGWYGGARAPTPKAWSPHPKGVMGYGEIRLRDVESGKFVIADRLTNYYWSPKFDGWNVTWDGKGKLYTKGGKLTLPAPQNFLDQLPRGVPVAGELIVRGQQATEVAKLRRSTGPWAKAKFYAFDLPANLTDPFSTRTKKLKEIVHKSPGRGKGTFRYIPQHRVVEGSNKMFMKEFYDITTCKGAYTAKPNMPCLGEGVVFTDPDSKYTPGRVPWKVRAKLKLRQDDEATVVGYTPKALEVRFNGRIFHLGIGVTDLQRANLKGHFPKGTIVKFSFRTLSTNGIPKEARLVGVRHKEDMTAPDQSYGGTLNVGSGIKAVATGMGSAGILHGLDLSPTGSWAQDASVLSAIGVGANLVPKYQSTHDFSGRYGGNVIDDDDSGSESDEPLSKRRGAREREIAERERVEQARAEKRGNVIYDDDSGSESDEPLSKRRGAREREIADRERVEQARAEKRGNVIYDDDSGSESDEPLSKRRGAREREIAERERVEQARAEKRLRDDRDDSARRQNPKTSSMESNPLGGACSDNLMVQGTRGICYSIAVINLVSKSKLWWILSQENKDFVRASLKKVLNKDGECPTVPNGLNEHYRAKARKESDRDMKIFEEGGNPLYMLEAMLVTSFRSLRPPPLVLGRVATSKSGATMRDMVNQVTVDLSFFIPEYRKKFGSQSSPQDRFVMLSTYKIGVYDIRITVQNLQQIHDAAMEGTEYKKYCVGGIVITSSGYLKHGHAFAFTCCREDGKHECMFCNWDKCVSVGKSANFTQKDNKARQKFVDDIHARKQTIERVHYVYVVPYQTDELP